MGRSEWDFLIKSKEDLKHVIDVVGLHNDWKNNDEVGEKLYFICIFKYKSKRYCCVANEGGRESTSQFIETHFKGKQKIYQPFDKPPWWMAFDKQKRIWQPPEESDIPNPDTIFVGK